tara:strand:+ start:737 stop:1138 length:402 start_codon:yes stop_codon:yes gene_type:complete
VNKIVSLLCGIVFGIGLVISEMINPEKVLGFLNIFRDWDPSLAFVMIGALVVSTPVFHLFKNKKKPLFSSNFLISSNKEVDKKLIIGSVLFGGWLGFNWFVSRASYYFFSFVKYEFCSFCNINVCWFLYRFKS